MRRVVTGTNDRGKVVVTTDDQLLEPRASAPFTTIWEADGPQTVPSDGTYPQTVPNLFPPVGGYRVLQYSLAPGFGINEQPPYDGSEAERNATISKALHIRPAEDAPGVHRTESVDIELILSGKVDLEIDDAVITLAAGDWVVQNGTRHAWRNPYSHKCQLIAIFIGAAPAEEPNEGAGCQTS